MDNVSYNPNKRECIASAYADTYLNDSYCDYTKPEDDVTDTEETQNDILTEEDDWKSPSDLLIGIIDLIPPFTSKITRGKTHAGILQIGGEIVSRERERFERYIKKLLDDNDIAWSHILEHEKALVAKKVKDIYKQKLEEKNKLLMSEMNTFYESTLQELEDFMRKEVASVLTSAHANIVSDMNTEIKEKLEKEKASLEKVLTARYNNEIKKMKHYYKLLLDNEKYRNERLINHALNERNEALRAFYQQIDAENMTSTMYMMCTERKKCRIKQFLLENYQSADVAEKRQKIKERQEILDAYKAKEKKIFQINYEWELKTKKILQLFLKFISFSLKLLPEQTTFLLDLEKMVVLQLNEIQKTPTKTSILVDEDEYNTFKFEEPEQKTPVCTEEPFVVAGDSSSTIPPHYGSRETLPDDVQLPMTRIQRKFIYAKCEKFNEVKAFLEAQRCKCRDPPLPPSPETIESIISEPPPVVDREPSINEPLLMEDIEILEDCPVRTCHDWAKRYSFPYINKYMDFTEDNYRQVKTIIGKQQQPIVTTKLIEPRTIIWDNLPFSATHEKQRHVATQCSSREDSDIVPCPCTTGATTKLDLPTMAEEKMPEDKISNALTRRRNSLLRLLYDNTDILRMFTDESFDFIYTIK